MTKRYNSNTLLVVEYTNGIYISVLTILRCSFPTTSRFHNFMPELLLRMWFSMWFFGFFFFVFSCCFSGWLHACVRRKYVGQHQFLIISATLNRPIWNRKQVHLNWMVRQHGSSMDNNNPEWKSTVLFFFVMYPTT